MKSSHSPIHGDGNMIASACIEALVYSNDKNDFQIQHGRPKTVGAIVLG
jgi:hypothetical protein